MSILRKALIIFIVVGGWSKMAMALEEPKYEILKESDDIQIRQYEPYLVAETVITGDFEDAGNMAFSRLFGYIDGENIRQESIEMTAPVTQEQSQSEGQEIEMTAPVQQVSGDSGKFAVSFVMPSRFTLETLPKPKDERVILREIPAKKVAVIEYSGTWSEDNYKEHEALLYQYLEENNYKIISDPMWARYDAPFVPWFMRRNEIMVEIK
jgi:effector-binding domain-containing protein